MWSNNEIKDTSNIDNESVDPRPIIKKSGRKSVYMVGLIAAGGGFAFGFDTGAISGIMVLDPFVNRFLQGDTGYRGALLMTMTLVTATIASFISGSLCDYIGRKNTILVGTGAFTIGALLETIGWNFGLLMTGRLFVELGEGSLINAVPLYHTEIAPHDIRGRLITLFSTMISVGIIVCYFVNFGASYITSDWSWRLPFLVQLVVCVLLASDYFLPYSPRWLIDRGQIELECSFGNRTFIECFRATNLKRTLLAMFTGNGAVFTGSYAITYYSPQIFQQIGIDSVGVSLATSGASNILILVMSIFTLIFIDKLGRRGVFISGALIMSVSMCIIGGLFQSYSHLLDNDTANLGNASVRGSVIAFVFIFQAAFAYSWDPVSFVYSSEISNTRTRAKVIVLSYGLNYPISIVMTFIIPIFMTNTIYGGYYFFGACCFVLFLGSFMLPETKGRTLEEIDRIFNPL